MEDEDVKKCLKMLIFLLIEEIEAMTCEKGENINKAKEVLAYEVTKLVHGEEVAKNTETAVKAAFSGEGDLENLPTTVITEDEAKSGIGLIDLMKRADLISSNSEGFRLVKQGGVSIGDEKVEDGKRIITEGDFSDNSLVIKKGKKVYHKIYFIGVLVAAQRRLLSDGKHQAGRRCAFRLVLGSNPLSGLRI